MMKLGKIFFLARLSAAIIILWFIDLGKLVHILLSIKLEYIIMAILLELAGFLLWTAKWKFLVDRLKKIKFPILFLGLMADNCLNTNVLRARTLGGFGRSRFLKNISQNNRRANWYATIVMDQTSNSFVFTPIVIFSLLFVFLFLDIPWWLSIIMETIVIIVLTLALAAYISRRKIEKKTIIYFFYSILQKIYNFWLFKFIRNRFDSYKKFEEIIVSSLTEFAKTYSSILKDKKILTRDLVLSAIMYTFIYSKSYILFKSVGYHISVLHLIVSLSLILWLISIFPIVGFKEVLMISVYSIVGVPVTTATVVSLLDRVIYLFFVIVIAYLSIGILRIFHIGKSNRDYEAAIKSG